MAHATRCPCGHRTCKDWHVEPVAAVQGVKFTEEQARAVAGLLNGGLEWAAEFEYQTVEMIKERRAARTNVRYRAADPRAAVDAALRFWKGRHEALPDHFARCGAIIIHEPRVARVGDDGELSVDYGRKVFEWKLETGMGPGVTVGPGLVDDPRMTV